jgi:hypothetical protein
MAQANHNDVRLYKGGTPLPGNYVHCLGTPQYFGPPFGGRRHADTPLGNSPYDAASPRACFTSTEPLNPSVFELQMNAFLDAQPDVGNIIQLALVPVNHYFWAVRVDVAEPDDRMAGATLAIAGQRYEETDFTGQEFSLAEDPEFDAAAQAQGLSDSPLDVRSSTALWLGKVASGYVMPYYVAPSAMADAKGQPVLLERGALVLGLKIKTLPSSPSVKIWEMRNQVYMSAVITAFNFKSNT